MRMRLCKRLLMLSLYHKPAMSFSIASLFKKAPVADSSCKSGGVCFGSIDTPLLNEQMLSELATQAQHLQVTRGYTQRLESHFSGTLPAKQIGSGMDYAESRVYQTGDDPRFINWRLTARSNETLVKTFHTESSPTMCVLLDRRAPMRFGTKNQLKVTQAAKVAGLLSYAAKQHRLALSGLILDEKNTWFLPNKNEQSFDSWLSQINKACPPVSPSIADKTDWQLTLQNLSVKNPLGSLVYLISDFSGLSDKHQHYLEELQSHHHVIAIHISDPAEHALSNNGVMRLQSLQSSFQTPLHFQVDSGNAKQQQKYQAMSESHHESIKQLFKKRGIEYVAISTTDESLISLLPLPLEAST